MKKEKRWVKIEDDVILPRGPGVRISETKQISKWSVLFWGAPDGLEQKLKGAQYLKAQRFGAKRKRLWYPWIFRATEDWRSEILEPELLISFRVIAGTFHVLFQKLTKTDFLKETPNAESMLIEFIGKMVKNGRPIENHGTVTQRNLQQDPLNGPLNLSI